MHSFVCLQELALLMSLMIGSGEPGITPVIAAIVEMGKTLLEFIKEAGTEIIRLRKERAGNMAMLFPPLSHPCPDRYCCFGCLQPPRKAQVAHRSLHLPMILRTPNLLCRC